MRSNSRRKSAAAIMACAVAVTAAGDELYRAGVSKWRKEREARLTADGGWLSVVGLFWLNEGRNTFGSDAACDIVLPTGSAPLRAGVFLLTGGRTSVTLEPAVAGRVEGRRVSGRVELRSDTPGPPDVLAIGRLSMHVIERGGRQAIRLKDGDSRSRREFTGLVWYPIDEGYRVEGRFVPYDPPRALEVPNVLGEIETLPSPGRAEFSIDGTPLRLDGVLDDPGASELFFIFRDRTSGKETYGAGRFLYADLPEKGRLILDFNKAHNPPCAFTSYATCPLPPRQNRLPVRIEAGEKRYDRGHLAGKAHDVEEGVLRLPVDRTSETQQ